MDSLSLETPKIFQATPLSITKMLNFARAEVSAVLSCQSLVDEGRLSRCASFRIAFGRLGHDFRSLFRV